MENNFFLIQNIVDSYYTKSDISVDHLKIASDFQSMLKKILMMNNLLIY